MSLLIGYPMAKNLRAKIPSEDTLYVFDVNKAATEKFKEEAGKEQKVVVANTARQVAEESVRSLFFISV